MPIAAFAIALLLQAPAAVVSGTVSRDGGQPLEGVLVALDATAALAVTDERGAFVLAIPPSVRTPLIVTASLPGYRRATVTASSGGSSLRIVLQTARPTFATSVTVIAAGGDPAAAS